MPYEEPGNDTVFGKTILSAKDGRNDTGVIYIHGTTGKGYMIHKNAAEALLSPEAIAYGKPFQNFLTYPDDTTACIIIHELAPKGALPYAAKPKERRQAAAEIAAKHTVYAMTHGITKTPARKKTTPDAPAR